MTIKSFDIIMGDKKETIEYEDDLDFGEYEFIMNQCADFSDMSKIKVNVPKYKELILLTVLRKAPFPIKDLDAIKRTKMSVIKQILKGVMKEFPLAKSLEESAQMIVGEEDVALQNKSIMSLQESLDGIN